MTMQVGMIGTDGIVLASDRKGTTYPPVGHIGEDAVFNGHLASKFKLSANGRIAVTCARDMMEGIRIAERIVTELQDEETANFDRRIYDICCEISPQNNVELLIGVAGQIPVLRLLQWFNRGVDIFNNQVFERVNAGDIHNPATFWTTRYYRRAPTETLKRLAAQAVTIAGEINPAGIKGLEIAVSDASRFHLIAEDENERLHAQAKALDLEAGQLIRGQGKNSQ